ncbi:male sterility protein-domain-containing protein, partial [Fomes fomentarius]
DVVLVTGTTGNYGTHLLEHLLHDNTIETVYAVNRWGSQAMERQASAFRNKGFDDSLLDSSKFRMVKGNLDAPNLDIEPGILEEICNSVTYIIHNAWHVGFDLPVESFAVYLRALRCLIELALSSPFMEPPKLQYISSIAVFQSCELPAPVPEVPMDPSSAMGTGYGESKWIGEYMLLKVAEQTEVPVQIVRLAQICGDQDGYWNEEEWFPCMVKSAFLTKCLPDIHGDAAFIPNYPAARALIEMCWLSEIILHLTHPQIASLRSLLASVAEQLDIPLVSWDAWLQMLMNTGKAITAGEF